MMSRHLLMLYCSWYFSFVSKKEKTIQEGDHPCIAFTVERRMQLKPLFVSNAASSCPQPIRMSLLSLRILPLFHHHTNILLTRPLLLPYQTQFLLHLQASPPLNSQLLHRLNGQRDVEDTSSPWFSLCFSYSLRSEHMSI